MDQADHDATPSAIDFWRAAVEAVAIALTPRRRTVVGTAVGLGLVLVLVALRVSGADRSVLLGWTWLSCLVAVVSPFTGLIALAGVLPFSEWIVFETVIGGKALIIPFVVAGVLLRPIRGFEGVPRAVSLGLALAVVTGGGVLLTAARFDAAVAESALHGWLAGIGGGLVLFAVAWWIARSGSVAPAVVAVSAVTIGAALSLAEFVQPGVIREGPLGVLLRQPLDELPRVTGIIPAPNAVATLFAANVAVLVPHVGRLSGSLRAVGWVAVALLVAAIVFTYSRSGIVSLVVVLILAVAARNVRWAAVTAVVSTVAVVVLLPVFLMLRAEALGVGASFDLAAVISGDARRLEGWTAALGMFRASPIVGHGFQAFRELAFQYGSTYVTAPHNEVLRFFAEGGLAAGAIAVAFLGALGVTLRRRADRWARSGLGALLALLVGGMFNNPFLYVQVVGPAFILIGVSLGARAEPGSPSSTEVSAGDGLAGG